MGMGLGDLPKNVELSLPPEYSRRYNYVWLGDLQQLPWTANDAPPVRLLDPELAILSLRQVALYYAQTTKSGTAFLNKTAFAPRVVKGASAAVINHRFDEHAAQVVDSTMKELGILRRSGMKVTPVTLGSHWGLLIAR